MQKGYAPVKNGKLYYEISGSGFPVILLHGFSLDSRMWAVQVADFARFYKVINLDLRGFGKSSLPQEKYSNSEDFKEFLDFLKISRAHILGFSLGADIALDFVVRYPQYVESLIMADAGVNGYEWSAEYLAYKDKIRKQREKLDLKGRIKLWLGEPFFEHALKSPAAEKLTQIINDYSGWYWDHQDQWQRVDPPAITRAGEIRQKVLILVGAKDILDFLNLAKYLRKKIRNSRLQIIAGSGHMSPMEKPVEFNRAVLEFLQLYEL